LRHVFDILFKHWHNIEAHIMCVVWVTFWYMYEVHHVLSTYMFEVHTLDFVVHCYRNIFDILVYGLVYFMVMLLHDWGMFWWGWYMAEVFTWYMMECVWGTLFGAWLWHMLLYMVWYKLMYMVDVVGWYKWYDTTWFTWYGDGFIIHVSGSGYILLMMIY